MTLSTSPELLAALDALAARRGESRSALVEMLLREHPLVAQAVRQGRETKHGRPIAKLLAIADTAKQAVAKREATGDGYGR